VEIPYPDNNNGMMEVTLYDNIYPDWLSLSNPVISNVSFANGILAFNTDVPCYSSLFRKTDAKNISLIQRNTETYKTRHSVNISDAANVSIGVINEAGKTALIDM
jgi:hypothetical protein